MDKLLVAKKNADMEKKENKLYKFDSQKRMYVVNPLDIMINDISVKELQDAYNELQVLKQSVTKLLTNSNYVINDKLENIVRTVKTIQNTQYHHATLRDGYILHLDKAILVENNPVVANGCYRIIDDMAIKDELKYKKKILEG